MIRSSRACFGFIFSSVMKKDTFQGTVLTHLLVEVEEDVEVEEGEEEEEVLGEAVVHASM